MAEIFLVAVVEVEKEARIICQATGCGHSVYRRIHIVLVDNEFILLGSDCYQRLYGSTQREHTPYYTWGEGRRLTLEERQRLLQNTTDFIEQLEAERLSHEAKAVRIPEARVRAVSPPSEAGRPPYRRRAYCEVNDPAAAPYEGPAVLRWKWISDATAAAAIVEACRADYSLSAEARVVLQSYETLQFRTRRFETPYLFSLEVSLRHFSLTTTAMRILHESGLIEPIL